MRKQQKPLLAFLIISFLAWSSTSNADIVFQEWSMVPYLIGGKTVSCSIMVTAINDKLILLTGGISVNMKVRNNNKDSYVMIKITSSKIQNSVLMDMSKIHSTEAQKIYLKSITNDKSKILPIKIHNAWMKSSSETSIGKIQKLDASPKEYYLGGTRDMKFFYDIIEGIVNDGVIIGYQELPDKFDIIFNITEPLSPEIAKELLLCHRDLARDQLGVHLPYKEEEKK